MRRLFRFPHRSARQVQADVDDELRFHIETRTDELVASEGLAPEAARARALVEFGDLPEARRALGRLDRQAEAARRRRDWLGELRQDAAYALRALRGAPAFALTAVLTLALGIGANAAIFSVVHAVLLRPLPFPQPGQLVKVWSANRTADNLRAAVSPVDVDDWRAQRRQLADLGAWWFSEGASGIDLTGSGEPQRLEAAFVTPGFFGTLGVNAALGRVPRDEEMVRGGNDKVVVLSDGFWRRQFGGAQAALGSTLVLGGQPFTVLGVMPGTFGFPSERVEVYVPYSTMPDSAIPRIRPVRIMEAVARLGPGVALEQGRAELNAIARGLARQYPENAAYDEVSVAPLQEALTGKVRRSLVVLFGAVGFVLLLACVNVAGLLLARATAREHELALRAALGAGRGRILRQLLTESLVLALLGDAAGLLVARGALGLLLSLGAGELPRSAPIALDGRVLAFALAISLGSAMLFGLLPALWATGRRLQGRLREGGRGLAGAAAQRLRNGLVVAEVAFALLLVAGAGLMARSFRELLRVDPGFRPENLVAVNFSIQTRRHPQYPLYYRDVIESVRRIPGVTAAGAAKFAPFRGSGERNGFLPPGLVVPAGQEGPTATFLHISEGYFHTIGARILEGREFTPQDLDGRPFVVVVNRALASRYFPDRSAVGQTLTLGADTPAEIVGVVADIRQVAIEEQAPPTIYICNMQNSRAGVTLVARTRGEPLAMAAQMRAAIWALDKDQPITAIFTFDDLMTKAVARPRLLTVLLGLFGLLGLALAALGIYGVLAYLVSERHREIGVRFALGALPSDVLRMIVRRGVGLTAAGAAVGLGAALALARSLQGVLYGVAPTDPATFAAVTAVLLGVAALASWIPARRAARLDPAEVLRTQ